MSKGFTGVTTHTYCQLSSHNNTGLSAISVGLSNVAGFIDKKQKEEYYIPHQYLVSQSSQSGTGDSSKIFRNMWDSKPCTYSEITEYRDPTKF